MGFLALFLLGLASAPSSWASDPGRCDKASLACGTAEETRQRGLAECRQNLLSANVQHQRLLPEVARSRLNFFDGYARELPKLCQLKSQVATIAQGPANAAATPTAADCGRFNESRELSDRTAKPLEKLESEAAKALDTLKSKYKQNAKANIERASGPNVDALRPEVLGVWGTVEPAKLTAQSPIPPGGLIPGLLRNWEAELEAVRRNQAFLDNRGLSGQQLADRCKSLRTAGTDPKDPKANGQGGPANGNDGNGGDGSGRPGSGASTTPPPSGPGTETPNASGLGEESWLSRNSTMIAVGGLGVGAAAIAGVLYYKAQQDKKLSKDATIAVQDWTNRNPEEAKEAENRAKDRDEKSSKTDVVNLDTTDLTPMEAGGKTLHFFPPVAQLLDRIATSYPAGTVTPAVMNCPAHVDMFTSFPVIAGKDSCDNEKTALKEIVKTGSICVQVQTPVEFLANLDPSEPDPVEMDKMEEILKLYGPALKRMQLFGAFQRQDYYDILSSAIVKVRMEKVRETLEKRRGHFATINKNLLKGGDCFKGTAEEKQKAINLFTRAYDETLALLHELEQTESLGVSRVLAEGAKLQAAGRSLPKLPYPSLTESERAFLTTSISGFLWRSRGGGIFHDPTNTNIRRVTFTLQPMSELARVNAGEKSSWMGTELWMKLFKPWGEYHDLGRLDGDKETDYQSMKSRGVEQVSGLASQAKSQGYDQTAILQSGPMMGDCYWYGFERASTLQMGRHLDNERPFQHAIAAPSQWGEFCTGLNIGYGLSRSLLRGR